MEEEEKKRSLLTAMLFAKVRLPIDVILLIVAATFVLSLYIFLNVPQLVSIVSPHIKSESEVEELKRQVSELISLPEDETPFTTTITDTKDYSDIPFLNKAQEGDKVLFYVKSRKAILFRPDTNIIIEVGEVDIK